jgi:hypothetical protein
VGGIEYPERATGLLPAGIADCPDRAGVDASVEAALQQLGDERGDATGCVAGSGHGRGAYFGSSRDTGKTGNRMIMVR